MDEANLKLEPQNHIWVSHRSGMDTVVEPSLAAFQDVHKQGSVWEEGNQSKHSEMEKQVF